MAPGEVGCSGRRCIGAVSTSAHGGGYHISTVR